MFTNDNKAHSCISCISSKGTSGLVHSKFHTMVPNVFSLIAAKQMEGCAEITYSDGKQMLRGPAAIHLSFQNWIVSPLPICVTAAILQGR
jgi:hypothetical protein